MIGALVAAHRARQTSRTVLAAAAALGVAMMLLAGLPTEGLVLLGLVPAGALAVFFGSIANAHMQLCSAPRLRGRVMAIYSMLTLGTTVIGGPLMGWVCQHWSPRVGLGAAGIVTAVCAAVLALRPAEVAAVDDVVGAHVRAQLLGGAAGGPVVVDDERVAHVGRTA